MTLPIQIRSWSLKKDRVPATGSAVAFRVSHGSSTMLTLWYPVKIRLPHTVISTSRWPSRELWVGERRGSAPISLRRVGEPGTHPRDGL
jgi:hypothetical protein